MPALLLAVLALLLVAAPARAAAPTTGFETRNGASFTTHAEELAFLDAVAQGSPRVRVTEAGRTKENRPLQLVEVGAPGPAGAEAARKRPTAMLVCSQHGNEPAGREACLKLLRDLAFTEDPALVGLLERTTFIFVPTANPDGRAANQRANRDSVDINRDHLTLDTPEARAMAALVRDWQPDVLLDLHEYGPSQPVIYDDAVLWLWPRNLNADQQVHDLSIEMGREYLVKASEEAGYPADEYGQAEVVDNDVAQTAGDGDEGIMRNAMGLRHVLGILVETRVDFDVRESELGPADQAKVQRRRVDSHLAVLSGMVRFMNERGADAARVTAEATERKIAEGAGRTAPVYFGGADNEKPAASDVVNPPPCGYELSDAMVAELEPRLGLHGIRFDRIAGGALVPMGQAAEPVIPLLLDARGERHKTAGKPLDTCAAPGQAPAGNDAGAGGGGGGGGAAPGGQPAAAPAPAVTPVKSAPSCASRRTVAIRLPRVRGKVYRTRVHANAKRVRVRRGVAYVQLRRARTTVILRIARRVVRPGGRRVLLKQSRTVRVCG
ncbi:MAG: putative carboxypeptidase [uncultured Solirubrobacteraceae bacterium]|uniref:Putative carboxypeptidase n=1 Tax=uncultured Solirubrobacteraceae bacterium TaxID=1162706 RepID=A0A6J4T7P3_9ACTN|nr:MAG: putative carboxypeptidase [uncultured Solirubrobacteraceae bacterium]